jgi:hypothetical protein
VVVAAILVALVPLTTRLAPLVALGVLAVVLVGLVGYEALRFAAVRDSVRHRPAVAA